MTTYIWVNIGSGNGLVPDGTNPLPEPVLTYHQEDPVATFVEWRFEDRIAFLKSHPDLPWNNGLNQPETWWAPRHVLNNNLHNITSQMSTPKSYLTYIEHLKWRPCWDIMSVSWNIKAGLRGSNFSGLETVSQSPCTVLFFRDHHFFRDLWQHWQQAYCLSSGCQCLLKNSGNSLRSHEAAMHCS